MSTIEIELDYTNLSPKLLQQIFTPMPTLEEQFDEIVNDIKPFENRTINKLYKEDLND